MRKLSSILIIILSLAFMPFHLGCDQKDVRRATREVVSGARDLVSALKASGRSSPVIDNWLERAERFQKALESSENPAELLNMLGLLVSTFRTDIIELAYERLGPKVGLAVYAIDVALRIVARHFVKATDGIQVASVSPTAASSLDELKVFLETPELRRPR